MAAEYATCTHHHKISTKITNEMRVSQIELITQMSGYIKWLLIDNKNSAEGVIAPAGAKVTGATIRMWLLNKFISFLAVLTWKTGLKKM